jgi:hypothetical protein
MHFKTLSDRTYIICDLVPCSNGERRAGNTGETGIKGEKKWLKTNPRKMSFSA